MIGEKVIVRAFGNEPLVRRVWEVTRDKVYICSDESFERIKAEGYQPDCFPIGFPPENVFRYDEDLFDYLTKNYKTPSAWDRLTVWHGDKNAKIQSKAQEKITA